MTPERAANLMREKADAISVARARMATAMRQIHALAGLSGVRACFDAEFERLTASNEHDRSFIG